MKTKTELEKKVEELGGRLIPFDKWDDNIADDLKSEGELSTAVVNKKVLKIWEEDGSSAELGYAKFNKITVMVCYGWVPLFRFEKYSQCFVKHWRDQFKKTLFFASVLDDCDLEKNGTVAILKSGGFKVTDFEGF